MKNPYDPRTQIQFRIPPPPPQKKTALINNF